MHLSRWYDISSDKGAVKTGVQSLSLQRENKGEKTDCYIHVGGSHVFHRSLSACLCCFSASACSSRTQRNKKL